jgi:S1-C subfamily serine protease
MTLALLNSITLITGSSPDSRDFGTGFVIHQDESFTYLLTCAHVVKDVSRKGNNIIVGGLPATVAAMGEENGFDLAVLKVEGLWDKKPLKLRKLGEKDKSFVAAGFSLFDKLYLLRTVVGELGSAITLESPIQKARTRAWELKIQGENYLQSGYSGSPVIDEVSNCVLGVISHKEGTGEKGLAISVEALEKIWQEMPLFLLQGKQGLFLRSFLWVGDKVIRWIEANA